MTEVGMVVPLLFRLRVDIPEEPAHTGHVERRRIVTLAASVAVLVFAAGAAVASGGDGDDREVRLRPVADDQVTTTTVETTTTVPATMTAPTYAPGFEDYKAGDPLPAPGPGPTPDNTTVTTVQGPYGPIYPDGYSDPSSTTIPSTTVPNTPPGSGTP
jgi:hypothetical protein